MKLVPGLPGFRLLALLALSLSLGLAAPAYAQRDGVIAGRVTDVDGTPIAGATVSVYSPDRGDTRTLETNAEGDYLGRGFRTDTFVITMSADGYQSMQQQVKVNFGMNTVDGRLAVAAASADVNYDEVNGLYQAGFAAYQAQDWTVARDSMAPLVAGLENLTGEEVGVMRASALEVLGRAYFELGDLDGSIATYDALLAIDPDSVPAHAWKSQAHVAKQDFEGALPHVRRAADLAPDDAAMQYNAAAILLQIGEVQEGISALERAVELRPDFPLAKKQLGYAYLRLGAEDPVYYEKALEQMRAYVELAPEAADRAEVEGMIAALQAQIEG